MATPDHIDVFVQIAGEDVRAGRLWTHRRSTESASFAYAEGYIARHGAYALDPELPLVPGQRNTPVGKALFGAFSDSTPDRWGRRLIQRTEAASARTSNRTPRSFGERDFLLGARDDMRQGAVRFQEAGAARFLATEDTGVPPLLALGTLLNASEAFDRGTANADDMNLLVHGGSSLGGARPKVHVIDSAGFPAIAKFPSVATDDWDVIRWEAVALTLAQNAGLTVARHQLHVIQDKPVVVVRRFDRRPNWERVGYVSAMTLLSANDGDRFDYLDLASAIEVAGDNVEADLRELWARAVYGRLISNTDDHLRNHGFLQGAAGWRLSPAFDLNPNPYRDRYATAFAGDDQGRLLPLIENAELFRLKPNAAAATLRATVTAVDEWERVAVANRISGSEITRMSHAFQTQAREDARDYLGGTRTHASR